MEDFIIKILTVVITASVSAVGLYIGYIHQLKLDAAVLKSRCDELQKDLENMQKRVDSHSRKNDEIMEKISSFEKEVLKQMGNMGASISSLSSDLKGLSNLILVSDPGIKIQRQ